MKFLSALHKTPKTYLEDNKYISSIEINYHVKNYSILASYDKHKKVTNVLIADRNKKKITYAGAKKVASQINIDIDQLSVHLQADQHIIYLVRT